MNASNVISIFLFGLLCTVLVLCNSSYASAQDRIRIAGRAAELISDHRVIVHSSKREVEEPYTALISDLPLRVNAREFGAAFVDFQDQTGKRSLAVHFNRDLFQEGKDETIRLVPPRLETQVSLSPGGELVVLHWAWISDEVTYATMPQWNQNTGKVHAADEPTIEVQVNGEAAPVVSTVMESNCLGFGWRKAISLPERLGKGTALLITVTHKTGDLFGDPSITSSYLIE